MSFDTGKYTRQKSAEEYCSSDIASSRFKSRPGSPRTQLDEERRNRREIANSNERRRMQCINAGFQSLKALMPQINGEKLSKAAILQHTTEYIAKLEEEQKRFISQNEHLRNLLIELGRRRDDLQHATPPPKRKKRDTESSDEGIGMLDTLSDCFKDPHKMRVDPVVGIFKDPHKMRVDPVVDIFKDPHKMRVDPVVDLFNDPHKMKVDPVLDLFKDPHKMKVDPVVDIFKDPHRMRVDPVVDIFKDPHKMRVEPVLNLFKETSNSHLEPFMEPVNDCMEGIPDCFRGPTNDSFKEPTNDSFMGPANGTFRGDTDDNFMGTPYSRVEPMLDALREQSYVRVGSASDTFPTSTRMESHSIPVNSGADSSSDAFWNCSSVGLLETVHRENLKLRQQLKQERLLHVMMMERTHNLEARLIHMSPASCSSCQPHLPSFTAPINMTLECTSTSKAVAVERTATTSTTRHDQHGTFQSPRHVHTAYSHTNLDSLVRAIRHVEGGKGLCDDLNCLPGQQCERCVADGGGESGKGSSISDHEELKSDCSGGESPSRETCSQSVSSVGHSQSAVSEPVGRLLLTASCPQGELSRRYPIASDILHKPAYCRPGVIVHKC